MYSQIDEWMDIQIGRQIRQINVWMDRWINRYTDRQIDRQIHKHIDRWIDRQIDRQTVVCIQITRQMHIHIKIFICFINYKTHILNRVLFSTDDLFFLLIMIFYILAHQKAQTLLLKNSAVYCKMQDCFVLRRSFACTGNFRIKWEDQTSNTLRVDAYEKKSCTYDIAQFDFFVIVA